MACHRQSQARSLKCFRAACVWPVIGSSIRAEVRPDSDARSFPNAHVPDGLAVLSDLPLQVRRSGAGSCRLLVATPVQERWNVELITVPGVVVRSPRVLTLTVQSDGSAPIVTFQCLTVLATI